ncbi:hypothetical protein ACE1CI_04775 [Aerosakkonemataceae cyanobacterium BLCC-F50]|uniref:Uncharacterized protein n=1 Tax=Floridaenema flaviceps BLCC-F50 TaxID=3153642 RepID=A0ABV4XLC7_9CYAN
MATTVTRSKAKTFARLAILKIQFRYLLRKTTDISLETLERLEKGLENAWIKKVNIYGFDVQKLCRAQITLQVDWDEYKYQLSCERATVAIDNKWIDDTAMEVYEPIIIFNDFVNEKLLTKEWGVIYTRSVYADEAKLKEVRSALGLAPRGSIKWAEEPTVQWSEKIQELPELDVFIRFVDY